MINTRNTHAKPAPPRTRRRQKQQRKCLECSQTFSKTEHLARHIRTHTKERPFACELCGKAYSRHDSLLRHGRTHGSGASQAPPKELTAVLSPPPSQIGAALNDRSLPGESLQAHDDVSATGIYAASRREPEPSVLRASSDAGPNAAADTTDMPMDMIDTSAELGTLDPGLHPAEPAWFMGADFDVDALNFYISAALSDWAPQSATNPLEQRRSYSAANETTRLQVPLPSSEIVSRVQKKWHTRVSRGVTPQSPTAQLSDQDLVDEKYREGLSHRLQPRMSNVSLPSADFLNLCIKLYFTKFNPAFPIIHAPTFRPSSTNALLLLSICSVGALFMGPTSAASQGKQIFQILNKAILVSWENSIRQGGREALSLAQAAIIGQTFGMLSGQPQDLCMTESFHGTVIAWSRQAGLFKIRDSLTQPEDGLTHISESDWKSWAQAEESTRLVLGLHIHDMEFATTFHHAPLLRHTVEGLPICCPEDLFNAPSAAQWYNLVVLRRSSALAVSSSPGHADGFEPPNHRSQMFSYASLAGIVSSIQEAKATIVNNASVQYFRERLLAWYSDNHKLLEESKHDPFNLVALWHTAFMCLYADFDLLERVLGRDGDLQAEQAISNGRAWASSSEARRGVLHALLVLKQLEIWPIGVEPAIHVPKAFLYAAIFMHCYTSLGPAANSCIPFKEEIGVSELQALGFSSPSNQISGRQWPIESSTIDSSIVCSTIDLLRRVGHWDISQRYASILESLLEEFTHS